MDTTLIQSDPDVMMGKPVIAGTRITVELILEKLSAGETVEQILEAHSRLTRESILALWRMQFSLFLILKRNFSGQNQNPSNNISLS